MVLVQGQVVAMEAARVREVVLELAAVVEAGQVLVPEVELAVVLGVVLGVVRARERGAVPEAEQVVAMVREAAQVPAAAREMGAATVTAMALALEMKAEMVVEMAAGVEEEAVEVVAAGAVPGEVAHSGSLGHQQVNRRAVSCMCLIFR